MGFAKGFCVGCLILIMITNAEPFLYNSGKEIITSLFASSSASGNNQKNIEDLTDHKPHPHKPHSNMHEDKHKENLLKVQKQLKERLAADEADLAKKTESEEQSQNEAQPGIVHKKINKILTKLQIFSTVRNSINSRRPKDAPSPEDEFFDEDDENDMSKNLNLLVNSNTSTEPTTHVYKITNKYIPPQSLERTTNQPAEDRADHTEHTTLSVARATKSPQPPTEEDGSKITLTPGSIGVYFMELLGSLATLIYGAALQVASLGSSSLPANNA